MTESKSHRWSILNDAEVVKAMRKDRNSEHWEKCDAFVRYYIEIQFSNLLPHLKEETTQDILLLAFTHLSSFRAESSFITWLSAIAHNRAIDVVRKQKKITSWEQHPDDLPEDHEGDIGNPIISPSRTPEQLVLTRELIEEVLAAIEDFLQDHGKSDRNREILQMVMIDEQSYEETAQVLNINAPVVGYVVRSARIYLREALSSAKGKPSA